MTSDPDEFFGVAADGTRLYFRRAGRGEPIVLIPGTSCDHSVWRMQSILLESWWDTISVDTRGSGRSDQPTSPDAYSVEVMAADLMTVLDAARVKSAHLVGHSLGAAIALRAAIDYPDRVSGLVLHAGWASTDRLIDGMFFRPMQKFLETNDRHGAFRLGQSLVMSHPYLRTREPIEIAESVRDCFVMPEHPCSTPGFVGQLVAGQSHDCLARLGEVTCPTLVMVGERDLNVVPTYSEELARLIPGAELKILRGERSSHFIQWEMADEFNSILLEFLKARRTSSDNGGDW